MIPELHVEPLRVGRLLVVALDRPGAVPGRAETPFQSLMRALGEPFVETAALRHRELGEEAAAEGDLQTAPAGDLDRVLQRLGEVLEQRGHLPWRLQVLLFAVMSRTPWIGEDPALVDADPRLVRLEVVAFQEADVVAGDDREPHRQSQIDGGIETRRIGGAAGALDAEVEPPRKGGRPTLGASLRLSGPTVQERLADVAAGSGRDGDEPGSTLPHPGAGGGGGPGAALGHVAPGQQPGELAVSRTVHGEQGQQAGGIVVRFPFERQIDADDRLDAAGDRGTVEAHHAEQVRVVGDRDRGHAQRLRPLDEGADPHHAVHERELGMQVRCTKPGLMAPPALEHVA